ncbi:MAG: hypothetical protein C0517_11950 [Erythrobacter sp.]|nr:hypothetical protein [Erythrobacter sp.]
MVEDAMEQLIYVSTASPSVDGGDVFDIIQRSSLRNPQRGITGFLIFVNGYFFQYIEGPAKALEQLLDDISRDSRHHSIKVLSRQPCSQRSFPTWKMKRLHLTDQAKLSGEVISQLKTLAIPAQAVRAVERFLATAPA